MTETGYTLYLPGDQRRRCSQPHCGNAASLWRAKLNRAGRSRVWAWCQSCAAVRGLVIECGRVVRREREGVE